MFGCCCQSDSFQGGQVKSQLSSYVVRGGHLSACRFCWAQKAVGEHVDVELVSAWASMTKPTNHALQDSFCLCFPITASKPSFYFHQKWAKWIYTTQLIDVYFCVCMLGRQMFDLSLKHTVMTLQLNSAAVFHLETCWKENDSVFSHMSYQGIRHKNLQSEHWQKRLHVLVSTLWKDISEAQSVNATYKDTHRYGKHLLSGGLLCDSKEVCSLLIQLAVSP